MTRLGLGLGLDRIRNKSSAVAPVPPTFSQNITALFGANLLSYLKLDETSGATAADASGNSRTGAYNNVTLNNTALPTALTGNAPLWDNADIEYVNWYTASLAAAFSGAAGTLAGFAKVYDANVWTDATSRYFAFIRADANNIIYAGRTATNNQVRFQYTATTNKFVQATSLNGSLGWFFWALTWDINAGVSGEVKAYLNGAQVGTTQTSLGTWAGAPASTTTLIGNSTQGNANNGVKGWQGHVFLLNRAATAAEILQVNTWAGT